MGLKNQFKGKTVFCNCDDPEWSNFWKYFVMEFKTIGLKKLISTHYEKDGGVSYKMEYTGETLNGAAVYAKTPLKGDGDFRSEECIELLKEADIIVTNPPFSLFREYIAQLMECKKKFVIMGNMNAIAYEEVFPLIRENKIWMGLHCGKMKFRVPDSYQKKNIFVENGIKYAKFGNTCWYTNLDVKTRHEKLDLYDDYYGNEEKYPQYDNYNAIECGKIDDIPGDYSGLMGVPITIFQHYNPEQFEVIGSAMGWTHKNTSDEWKCSVGYKDIKSNSGTKGYGIVNGEQKYHRILVKNKNPRKRGKV